MTLNPQEQDLQFISDNYPFLTKEMGAEIEKLYPEGMQIANHSAFFTAAAAAWGELTFNCPGIFIVSSVAKYGNTANNWLYQSVICIIR